MVAIVCLRTENLLLVTKLEPMTLRRWTVAWRALGLHLFPLSYPLASISCQHSREHSCEFVWCPSTPQRGVPESRHLWLTPCDGQLMVYTRDYWEDNCLFQSLEKKVAGGEQGSLTPSSSPAAPALTCRCQCHGGGGATAFSWLLLLFSKTTFGFANGVGGSEKEQESSKTRTGPVSPGRQLRMSYS